MHSFRESHSPSFPELSVSLPLPTDITVGLAAVPLLAVLSAGPLLVKSLTQLGIASEELFRGDRLPARPLMPTVISNPDISKPDISNPDSP